MANPRNPKRARKKERRNMRRDEWRAYVKRQRRKRWGFVLGGLSVVALGVLIGWAAFLRPTEPSASPTPAASAAPTSIKTPAKRPVACGATVPKSAGSTKKQYPKAADQKLEADNTYIWRLETSCGTVDIELDVENSPKTANSVAFLTREGFYDGTLFHRLVKDFVNQGGDPKGDGTGGPGYQMTEPPADDFVYEEGVVAMAKGEADPPGTSGSQFFIVVSDHGQTVLTEPIYAVLGKVASGTDVVKEIEQQGHAADNVDPKTWVYIERATIVEQ